MDISILIYNDAIADAERIYDATVYYVGQQEAQRVYEASYDEANAMYEQYLEEEGEQQ